jgi:hypothetical protein
MLGWCAATALFVGLIALFGGPSSVDANETSYPTWAIAHGQFACAYPSVNRTSETQAAPLYPLLSGGIALVAGVGDRARFPSTIDLGPSCDNSYIAMTAWSLKSDALPATTWIGSATWLALLAGVISWLRASGRGRTGWEPVTLIFLAALLPVWVSIVAYFHPQDLLALGLALAGMACAARGQWVWAGILCALAVLSQQFALLVAAPLFVLAPAGKRARFVMSGTLIAALVVVPFLEMTSGHALRSITLGTGDSALQGGTVLWETGAHGLADVLLYRVTPVVVALLLSSWVVRRLGQRALMPVPLISLVAVSLSLRLVFETTLFTYYFMALAVSLVLIDVTRGSLRRTVGAWLAVLTLLVCRIPPTPFSGVTWGDHLNTLLPIVIGAVALGAALLALTRRHRATAWPWLTVAAVDFVLLLPLHNAITSGHSVWSWQLVLVLPGVVLAAQPLVERVRRLAAPVLTTTAQIGEATNETN